MVMDMDDFRPRSVFVVLRHKHTAPQICSILQFQSKENNKHDDESSAPQVDLKEVAHFANPMVPARWLFSPLSNEELLMVPYIGQESYEIAPPFNGIAFNLRTKTLRTTIPPFTFNHSALGCAVNLGGSLYFMPHPYDQGMSPDRRMSPHRFPSCNSFERFVPAANKLETLQPFPLPSDTAILATAVLEDTILFNMGGCDIWAYNVTHDKWYPVTVEEGDKLCYKIEGEAVVLGNTIYALKDHRNSFPYEKVPYISVLALSIQKGTINGEIAYTCSLLCEISVPSVKRISSMYPSTRFETRYLVHLGKDDFCLVQSCECAYAYQPISLTYMTLKGNNSMIVTHNCCSKFPTGDEGAFRVAFCFSMPEFKTPPTLQQAQKFFDINPFPEGFDRQRYNEKTSLSAILQVSVPSQTNVFDGHDISSLDAAVKELLSLYPALKAELAHHPGLKASLPPKESSLGDGWPASKRLKTAGGGGIPPRSSDIEQGGGGGSKTRDTSTPEIHMQEKSSAASVTSVGDGEIELVFHGRPISSYTFPEKIIISRSLKHQYKAIESRPSPPSRPSRRSQSRATRSRCSLWRGGVLSFRLLWGPQK